MALGIEVGEAQDCFLTISAAENDAPVRPYVPAAFRIERSRRPNANWESTPTSDKDKALMLDQDCLTRPVTEHRKRQPASWG